MYTRDQGEIRNDSAMDELVAAVQMAVARHENDVKSEKLRAVYARRRAAGQVLSIRCPYGLTITDERQFVVRKDGFAKTIRTTYRMRATGVTMARIAEWMRKNAPPVHYPHSGRTYRVPWDNCHKNWTPSHVGNALEQRFEQFLLESADAPEPGLNPEREAEKAALQSDLETLKQKIADVDRGRQILWDLDSLGGGRIRHGAPTSAARPNKARRPRRR